MGLRRSLRFAVLASAVALALPAAALGEPQVQAGHAAEGDDPLREPEAETGHAAELGELAEHGEGHGHAEINWAHGFVGEKEGVEPSLLWRPPGMPAPFLANVINFVLLVFLLVKFGGPAIADGLKKRKTRIVAGMEEAGKMKDESATRLAEYEEKLKHIDEEIERIKKDMKESAEAERERILADAKERRERMERDAQILVEQEMKAAREMLMRETVKSAVRSAEELLSKQLTSQDHERLANEYLDLVKKSNVNAPGGKA